MLDLHQSRKVTSFYLYASLLAIAGWLWLLWSLNYGVSSGFTPCLIRNVSGVPCPACGSTTALSAILHGDFSDAWYTNPLGYIAGLGLILIPVWLVIDLLKGATSMKDMYYRTQAVINKKPLLLIVILFPVLLIWIWNILKT